MIRRILIVVSLACCFVVVSDANATANDDPRKSCGSWRPCELSGGAECHPPSSLMPAYPDQAYPYQVPGEDGNCGFESCWRIVCPCGDPVSAENCLGPDCIASNKSSPGAK